MRNTIETIFNVVNARYGYKLVTEYEQTEKFYPSVKNLCLALEDKIIELEDKLSRRNMQIKDLKAEIHKKQMEINQLYRDIEKAKNL